MKKLLLTFCTFFLVVALFSFIFISKASSDELDDLNNQLNELTKSLEMSKAATAPLESQLNSMRTQIDDIKGRVAVIEDDVATKRKEIDNGYKSLAKQEQILHKAINQFYIDSYQHSPLLVLLSVDNASQVTQLLAYQKAATDRDKAIIANIVLSLTDLEEKKVALEDEQTRLFAIKADLDIKSAELDKIVVGAKQYQAVLSSQIAQLTARQQQILAEKLGSLNLPTSLGAGPLYCTDDRKLDPGFSPAFAFFTFGIPHRVGMNQYGAQGRANAGQPHEDILRAYFDNISFENRSSRIKVQGYGEMDIEEYMLGIYEMPNSFHVEALKAQAVAARSYALSYTNNGEKEICTTQACQVYKGGNKGGTWEQAVRETAGKVMISGGQVVTGWYASTFGGYTFTNNDVWGGSQKPWTKRMRDTNGDVGNFDDVLNKSYDKDSPCLYAAQGFRSDYARSAWLKPSEVADIVNVILLARRDSGTRSHLYQTDKPNPEGQENWDMDRVRQELRSRGGSPFNNISSVSVSADFGQGTISSVNISGDSGSESFSGTEFSDFFNLRAPANIQIVGPLFNIERK